jgi:predicted amidohydrolase
MSSAFTASCIQFTSARDYEPNIRVVSDLVRRARDGGADFVLTPENTGLTEPIGKLRWEKARDEANHPVLAALREIARETGVWLLIGSLAVDLSREPATAENERRLANRSYLVNPDGAVVARYDKIHMFDVDLAGGESYRESSAFRPGGQTVLAETPWGVLGMTVCYDLRFPQLYRTLAQAGADFLAIPPPSRCRPEGALACADAGAGDRKWGSFRPGTVRACPAGGPTATR